LSFKIEGGVDMERNGPNKDKTEQTKRKIKLAVAQLNKDKDIDKITINEVVKTAAITRSTFYVYFDNIFEVISDIEKMIFMEIDAKADEMRETMLLKEKYSKPCEAYYQLINCVKKYKDYLLPLLGPHGCTTFIYKGKRRLYDDFIYIMRKNNLTLGKYERYNAIYKASSVIEIFKYWLENNDLSVEELAELVHAVMLHDSFVVRNFK
jgi:AcrR family transcriptional regulator